MRICAGTCGQPLEESNFYPRTAVCKPCYYEKKKARQKARKSDPQWRESQNLQARAQRQDPAQRAAFILIDSRQSDRRSHRTNDLTKEYIEAAIRKGCAYCGEPTLKMTLDRIDNTLGHTQTNVVPSCVRCNYTRRDMPYAAWLLVASAMRQARIEGLFGEWTCYIKR